MDGDPCTEVSLDDQAYIALAGGDGAYFVFIWTAGERILVLIDSANSSASRDLVVGGQEVVLKGNRVVGLARGSQVARHYHAHRSADPSLNWVEE